MTWIDDNPDEFIKLYQRGDQVSTHAGNLFDIIMNLTDQNSRRETLWPVAMALLLLCPDSIAPAIRATLNPEYRPRNDANYASVSKKIILLDMIRKCLKIDGLAELAAICMTDCAKAAYLLPKDENPDLRRYVVNNKNDLHNLIFNGSSRIYKHNKDRARLSELVLDKIIAVFRADHNEFIELAINKAYLPGSNTYITFNMARFCREYLRRTRLSSGHDEISGIYPTIAPKMRRELLTLLQSYSPTSPTSPDRTPSKGAPPVDKADIIAEILRNYVSNIDIALEKTKLDDKFGASDDQVVFAETSILEHIIEESVACRHPEIAEVGADFLELLYVPENAWRWTEYAKFNPDGGQLFWQYTYVVQRSC
jgi:hypothetical protein